MNSNEAMKRINEILYPSFQTDYEWSLSDIELIARVVTVWKEHQS